MFSRVFRKRIKDREQIESIPEQQATENDKSASDAYKKEICTPEEFRKYRDEHMDTSISKEPETKVEK